MPEPEPNARETVASSYRSNLCAVWSIWFDYARSRRSVKGTTGFVFATIGTMLLSPILAADRRTTAYLVKFLYAHAHPDEAVWS